MRLKNKLLLRRDKKSNGQGSLNGQIGKKVIAMLRIISRDVMEEVAAASFVAAVICFCTLLFAHTLAGVACGPAAHPAVTCSGGEPCDPPLRLADSSETSGVESANLSAIWQVRK